MTAVRRPPRGCPPGSPRAGRRARGSTSGDAGGQAGGTPAAHVTFRLPRHGCRLGRRPRHAGSRARPRHPRGARDPLPPRRRSRRGDERIPCRPRRPADCRFGRLPVDFRFARPYDPEIAKGCVLHVPYVPCDVPSRARPVPATCQAVGETAPPGVSSAGNARHVGKALQLSGSLIGLRPVRRGRPARETSAGIPRGGVPPARCLCPGLPGASPALPVAGTRRGRPFPPPPPEKTACRPVSRNPPARRASGD
jgi:hypothetical protein